MKKYYPIAGFAFIVLIIMIFSVVGLIDDGIGMCVSLGLIVILNLTVAIIAFKHEIKLVGFLMIGLTVLGVILLGLNLYTIFGTKKENSFDFQVLVKENESPKTKLFSYSGKDYYTYNLSEVNILMKKENKDFTLSEALNGGYVKLEDILNMSIPNDGTTGYKIYYDGGTEETENDAYSLIVCENNNDVIFSNFNYTYSEDICKN